MASVLRQRRALPAEGRIAEAARLHVAGRDGLSPVEQLEIYRRQFWLRHTASLLEDFPGLARVLGQTDWERLVEGYLDEIAPTSWTLRDLGSRMPAHVERSTWLPHHGLCVDMARLEWTYVEIFDAPEAPRPMLDALSFGPEGLLTVKLEMSPAMALLRVSYPVARMERRLGAGETPLEIPPLEPENLVLYRDAEGHVTSAALSDAAFELLRLLRDGVPLVEACERAADAGMGSATELEAHAGEWFTDFARHGWIVGVRAA